MIWRVILDDQAQDEFNQAFDYYESRQSGLGDRFTAAVQNAVDRIAVNPEAYPIVYKATRRSLVQGFPYCLYYLVEIEEVQILSVFHTSRDPWHWQSRS